ncbi:hypothetical protein [Rheinheimera sp.]|uniref:hypothetical protein n=1 Tax=Rheinheimera sp. TaxID=1869214 RepID=UPI004047D3A8
MSNPAAQLNLERFTAFVAERNTQGDWEDYALPDRLELNKKMIARECDFDRKRITENSKIKAIYDAVVCDLVGKGILLKDTRSGTDKLKTRSESLTNAKDKAALKKSQETNAALEEELYHTRIELDKANRKLTRLEAIERYLLETGRL